MPKRLPKKRKRKVSKKVRKPSLKKGIKHIFLDSASHSSGWAVFVDGVYYDSGRYVANPRMRPFVRFVEIASYYRDLGRLMRPTKAFVEFHGRNNMILHFADAVIGTAFAETETPEIDWKTCKPNLWQKYVKWNGDRGPLKPYIDLCDPADKAEDELSAIGMGVWYYANSE